MTYDDEEDYYDDDYYEDYDGENCDCEYDG